MQFYIEMHLCNMESMPEYCQCRIIVILTLSMQNIQMTLWEKAFEAKYCYCKTTHISGSEF